MKNHKKDNLPWTRQGLRALFFLPIAFSAACDGVVGTGSSPNPKPDAPISNFPTSLSTSFPATLYSESALAVEYNMPSIDLPTTTPEGISAAWQQLEPLTNDTVSLHHSVRDLFYLIDNAMPQIQTQCQQWETTPCRIAADTVSVQYTNLMIGHLTAGRTIDFARRGSDNAAFDAFALQVEDAYKARLNNTYHLGASTVEASRDANYRYQLTTSLEALFPQLTLSVQWSDAHNHFAFQVTRTNSEGEKRIDSISVKGDLTNDEYSLAKTYGKLSNRQLHLILLGSDPHAVALRAKNDSNDSGVTQRHLFSGRAYNLSADIDFQVYTATALSSPTLISAVSDVFDQNGLLVNQEACSPLAPYNICINDIPGNGQISNKPPLESLQSQSTIVNGLPADVFQFKIVRANTSLPTQGVEALCDGYQNTFQAQEVFCWQTPKENALVVRFSEDDKGYVLIPNTSIVNKDNGDLPGVPSTPPVPLPEPSLTPPPEPPVPSDDTPPPFNPTFPTIPGREDIQDLFPDLPRIPAEPGSPSGQPSPPTPSAITQSIE